jgi:hypothetical protein
VDNGDVFFQLQCCSDVPSSSLRRVLNILVIFAMLSILLNAAYSALEERARVLCTKETCPLSLSVSVISLGFTTCTQVDSWSLNLRGFFEDFLFKP